VLEKQLNMNGELMKKVISDLTLEQQLELEALAAMSDDEINTDDIPEVTDWSDAKHGMFYPVFRTSFEKIKIDSKMATE